MDERRQSIRRKSLLGARLVFNARSSTLSCTIRNYCEDGALLCFGERPFIPDQLEILLDNRSTIMPLQVMWRRGDKVGIAFPRGRFMNELKEDAAKTSAAGSALLAEQTFH